MVSSLTRMSRSHKAGEELNHPHSHSETRYVLSRTPLNRTDLALELPSLDFATDVDFPQTYHTVLISADGPCSVGADADAPGTALGMGHLQALVVRERLEATWAGELGDQRARVDVELLPLDSGCEVEVELSAEPLLDEPVVGRDVSQGRVFLRYEIAFPILRVLFLPFLLLLLGQEVLFWGVVGFGVCREGSFGSREGRRCGCRGF